MKTLDEIRQKLTNDMYYLECKAKEGLKQTVDWVEENRDFVTLAAPVAVAAVTGSRKVRKSIKRNRKLKQELEFRSQNIWDASMGCWLHIKRGLRPEEITTIKRRMMNGEQMALILDEMRLLK